MNERLNFLFAALPVSPQGGGHSWEDEGPFRKVSIL